MKLLDQIIDHAKKEEYTGIILLDAIIADATDNKRMATKAELKLLRDWTPPEIPIEIAEKEAA